MAKLKNAPPPPPPAPKAGAVQQSAAALAALDTPKKKGNRQGLSAEAIRKSAERKRHNTLFSLYVMACQASPGRGRSAERQAAVDAEIAHLRACLETGTQPRAVPLYTDETVQGERNGKPVQLRVRARDNSGRGAMVVQQRPLKPHEVLRLRAQLRALEGDTGEGQAVVVDADLRAQFLAMLPTYAGYGYSAQDLLDAGVPEADLREVGLILTVAAPAEG